MKANLIRGTVHLVTREQYWGWRLAARPALMRVVNSECRRLWEQVDETELMTVGAEIVGNHDGMTRGAMGTAAAKHFTGVDAQALGFAMRMLLPVVEKAPASSWTGRGTQYVLASSVMPGKHPTPRRALEHLRDDFVAGFGPATQRDFAYWAGLPLSELASLDWTDEADDDQRPPARLVLPEFDNLFYCRKGTDVAPLSYKRNVRIGIVPGTILNDDEVVATWAWTKAGGLALDELAPLTKATQKRWDEFRTWYEAQ